MYSCGLKFPSTRKDHKYEESLEFPTTPTTNMGQN